MARERDLDKIETIKETALEIILKEGFAGLKMTELARKSGVATGTVYVYFKNKDELINKLFKHTTTHAVQAFSDGLHTEMSVSEVLERLYYNCLNHYLNNPQENAFNEQYYRSSYLSEDVLEATEKFFEPILMLIQRGIDAGYLRQVNNRIIAAQVIGGIHEYVKWHDRGLIVMNEKLKREAFEMALAAVLNPDTTAN